MKSIDEQAAREIVLFRISEALVPDGPSPLRVFADTIHREGLTRRRMSVPTLTNLLTGHMYPNLEDRDGNVFKWDEVPRRTCGRVVGAQSVGSHEHRIRKLEQQIVELTRRLS